MNRYENCTKGEIIRAYCEAFPEVQVDSTIPASMYNHMKDLGIADHLYCWVQTPEGSIFGCVKHASEMYVEIVSRPGYVPTEEDY